MAELLQLLEPESHLPLSERVWSFANREKPTGPFSEARMHALLDAGEIRADTLVWRQGMAEWATAATVEPFAARLREPSAR
jgi:hypothetical protein